MNFHFSEEQTTLRELSREILEKELDLERLKEVEAEGDWFDRELWAKLAEANLLGLAVPEALGGMEMGFLELCVLLQEVGRAAAPLPALPALVYGGLAIARFGSDAQQQRWLAPLASGEVVLTGAFEPGEVAAAQRSGEGWRLDGVFRNVPAVHLAKRILLPAGTPEGEAVFLVDPEAEGVSLVRQATSRKEPVFEVTLAGVGASDDDVLRAEGITDWITERACVALAALQSGVSERALEITTAYVKEREQFGAPLGALPAVQHRCADAYIDLEAMRWVMWSAAWKLTAERPASRDVLIAKFWAADAGSRIATATQHLHGGMGVDLDYPIHRYFLWTKTLELALGSATPQLVKLGRDMALSGPQELA
ncbi:MAG: acyl-CoA/acyl-ACP dehydrogenase [Deltaproteobacteria bacterium]|nr:acyl-CoA/acyl-ACP dehydrogenase [Deltaproteobacteria bacterium]